MTTVATEKLKNMAMEQLVFFVEKLREEIERTKDMNLYEQYRTLQNLIIRRR